MNAGLLGGPRGRWIAAALFVAGLALPWLVYPVFAINLVCFGLFAVSLDLLFGFAGLLSFGHALFWGGAGYAATLALKNADAPFPLALAAGVAYAALLAIVVGFVSVRRQGIYFAMITLAIAQIQYFFAFQLTALTGGENGVQVPTRGWFFDLPLQNDRVYYYVAFAIVVLGVWFAVRVVRSPFGAVLGAMRENERRAISLGYDTARFKLWTFVMSGTLAGVAGSLYAIGNKLSGLDGVAWQTSGKVVMMTVLGGIGTIFGPIIGAGLFESLEYFVSKTPIGDKTNIVLGTVFALVVLVARRGIVGEILHAAIRRTANRAPLVTLLGLAILAGIPAGSRAADGIEVFCAGAASVVVRQVAASYAASHGTPVEITEGTVGQLRARLSRGERADVVILSAPAIADLEKSGDVLAGSSAPLGRTGIGVGIRTGAKAPDLSSTEALKATLLAAASIAYVDPDEGASSAIYFAKLQGQLGIADEVKKKSKLVKTGFSCELVADGRAEICVQNITEILPVKGVIFAGPFPAAVQNFITYTAAVPKNAPSTEAGRAFIAALVAPAQAPVWKNAGFEGASR